MKSILPRFSLPFLCSLLLMSLFSSSCNKDSGLFQSERVYAIYQLIYFAEEDQTYARTTFRLDNGFGLNLQLNDPGQTNFENSPLPFVSGDNYYERSFDSLISGGQFNYTDLNGEDYSNGISIEAINFPLGLTEGQLDQDFTLKWIGEPLGPNESVLLQFRQTGTDISRSFSQEELDSDRIVITTQEMQEFAPGEIILDMERLHNPDIQEHAGPGGQISGSYIPQSISVMFER